MGALTFTIKTAVLTALLIAVLQIRWDKQTLEDHLARQARVTGVMDFAQSTAQAAKNAAVQLWNKIKN